MIRNKVGMLLSVWVVCLTVSSAIAGDYEIYGNAEIGIWRDNNVEIPQYSNTAVSDKDTALRLDEANSFIGCKLDSEFLSIHLEVTPYDGANVRTWYGLWKKNGWEIKGGQDLTPMNFLYSSIAYERGEGEEYSNAGYGLVNEGRHPMIQIKTPSGLRVALVKFTPRVVSHRDMTGRIHTDPDAGTIYTYRIPLFRWDEQWLADWDQQWDIGAEPPAGLEAEDNWSARDDAEKWSLISPGRRNVVDSSHNYLNTRSVDNYDYDVDMPKIEVGYSLDLTQVRFDLAAAYTRFKLIEDQELTTETETDIIAWMFGVGVQYESDAVYCNSSFSVGQNPGSMGATDTNILSSAVLDDNNNWFIDWSDKVKNTTRSDIEDVDYLSYFINFGIWITDGTIFEIGGGEARSGTRVSDQFEGLRYQDRAFHYYIQFRFDIGHGLSMITEAGQQTVETEIEGLPSFSRFGSPFSDKIIPSNFVFPDSNEILKTSLVDLEQTSSETYVNYFGIKLKYAF